MSLETHWDETSRWKLAADVAELGFWDWNLSTNEVFHSEAWWRLFGTDNERVDSSSQETLDRVHPDDRERLVAERASLARGEAETFELEYRARHANGGWVWIAERARAYRDESGQAVRLIGTGSDVTKYRQREREFEQMMAALPVVVYRTSEPLPVTSMSPSWNRRTGGSLDEALGTRWGELIHPDDLPSAIQGALDFAEDTQRSMSEPWSFRHRQPDGSYRWVQAQAIRERDESGNSVGYIGTLSDITELKEVEQQLQTLNRRLCTVLKISSIGIWEWAFGDDRLVWDEQMFEIYGVDPARFRGIYADWSDRLHPDDRGRLTYARSSLENDGSAATEFRIIRPDGEVRHIYSNVFFETNDEGKPIRTIGLNMDITDRRETELALLESETKFQRIAEHVPGMVYRYVIHPDGSDALVYVSSRVRDYFGLEREEALEDVSRLWARVHEGDLERLGLEIVASAESLKPFDSEYRLIHPEKGLRWVQSFARPFRADSGDVLWDGILVDHTERKTGQLALQEAQSQFQLMTESIPAMTQRYVLRADGTQALLYASPQVRELFGVDPQEAVRDFRSVTRWIHPEDGARMRRGAEESAASLTRFQDEFRIDLPDRGRRWYQVMGRPRRQENGDVVWTSVILDITPSKDAELKLQLANDELARATQMKDEFLATISHELRTPLTAILGMTEGLQEGLYGAVTERQGEGLRVIEQSGAHLLQLINEILDLAKIESGQIELSFAPIPIVPLCEACLRMVAQLAEKKNIQLRLEAPRGLPILEADERRIRQVLINLLANAVKFTPDGGQVCLEVRRLEPAEESREETLRLSVMDTGIGIEASKFESLFQPFVQVDTSLSRKYEGTGLGLALVKRFVDLHSGCVEVASELGQGSCFTVDLPLRQAAGRVDAAARVVQSSPGDEPRGDDDRTLPASILLAEDNELVASATIRFLEASNFRVRLVTDGQAAIEAARDQRPDLILMDIQLPEVDGLEAIQRIREIPGLGRTPIIALTGFAMRGDSSRCLDAGADLYLSKPYRMRELVRTIQETLSQSA